MENIILIIICGISFYFCHKFYKDSKQTKEKNFAIEKININLENQKNQLEKDINEKLSEFSRINQDIIERQNNLSAIDNVIKSMQISQEIVAKEKADLEYEKYRVSLEDEYDEVLQDLMKTSKNLREEIVKEQFELNILKSKQAAYIAAQKRKEEMAANKNYYQLNLSDDDLGDIYNIRNVQKTLVRKEAVDKVLWEIYYKPAYDTLMIHLFGDRKDKVSGIYKITSVTNDKAYIGQSVDIKERLKSHIKSTISYSSTSNKLYSTMKSEGIQNFTFEILEEVPRTDLNEREIYWIEMYKTQDYGMNSTRGGS